MTNFLTVREAAKTAGRSTSFIRRIIYPILGQVDHPDRRHVEPSPERVQELRMKGETFGWSISEELLRREMAARKMTEGETEPATATAGDDPSTRDLIVLLRDQLQQSQQQLQVKDRQIESLSELMKSLNERLREGNILIGSLQKQLSPPLDTVKDASVVATQQRAAPKPPHAPRPATRKNEPAVSKVPQKKTATKGFFARLFSASKVN
jgi:hypothetical protein